MTEEELISGFKLQYERLEAQGLKIIGCFIESSSSEGKDIQIDISRSADPEDEVIPGFCHLSVMHPFIFDNRKIPEYLMGVKVLNIVEASTIPPEIEEVEYDPAGFEVSYIPGQFKRFVRNNMDLIRRTLREPEIAFADMLDAICYGDFKKYEREFEEKRLHRLIS